MDSRSGSALPCHSRPPIRNLLFGILALQMDFITRDALVDAMNAWLVQKNRPLAEILEERAALARSDRGLLEPLVRRHIEHHGNDPAQSLASISSVQWIQRDLEPMGKTDSDVQRSLDRLTSRAPRQTSDPTRP